MLDRRDELSAVAEASATDVESPEAAVLALYDTISGPAGQERDWDRLRSLFDPRARFLIGRWLDGSDPSDEAIYEWDLTAFAIEGRQYWLEHGFWERQLVARTVRFGNVAHVLSSYESRVGSQESEPVGRGVNSVQLIRYARRWWIVSVLWDVESTTAPMPPDLEG